MDNWTTYDIAKNSATSIPLCPYTPIPKQTAAKSLSLSPLQIFLYSLPVLTSSQHYGLIWVDSSTSWSRQWHKQHLHLHGGKNMTAVSFIIDLPHKHISSKKRIPWIPSRISTRLFQPPRQIPLRQHELPFKSSMMYLAKLWAINSLKLADTCGHLWMIRGHYNSCRNMWNNISLLIHIYVSSTHLYSPCPHLEDKPT